MKGEKSDLPANVWVEFSNYEDAQKGAELVSRAIGVEDPQLGPKHRGVNISCDSLQEANALTMLIRSRLREAGMTDFTLTQHPHI